MRVKYILFHEDYQLDFIHKMTSEILNYMLAEKILAKEASIFLCNLQISFSSSNFVNSIMNFNYMQIFAGISTSIQQHSQIIIECVKINVQVKIKI